MQRYESYKPSGTPWLGEIPSHWRVQPLVAIATKKSICNCPEKELLSVYLDKGVIKFSDVGEKRTNATSDDLSKYQEVLPGDFVLNNQQAWRGSVGVSEHEGIVSPAYIVLQLKKDLNPRFANYLFRDGLMVSQYLICSKGVGTIQRNLYWPQLKRSRIAIPPHYEQNRIVDFLDLKTAEIDVAISKKIRLLELFAEQRNAAISKETRKRIDESQMGRDSSFPWLGKFSENDRLTRLGFIAKIGNGSTPNRSVLGYWVGGNIPWLNSSKVNDFEVFQADQFVTNRAARECHLPVVKNGSLLIAITGEGRTRGTTAITRIDTTINQHLAYITVTDPQVEPEFLLYYLTGIYQILRDESSAQGSTKGAITCGELAKVPVLLPPLEEQRAALVRIKNQLQHINQSRDVIQRQIDALQAFRSTLISEAVSGKLKI